MNIPPFIIRNITVGHYKPLCHLTENMADMLLHNYLQHCRQTTPILHRYQCLSFHLRKHLDALISVYAFGEIYRSHGIVRILQHIVACAAVYAKYNTFGIRKIE